MMLEYPKKSYCTKPQRSHLLGRREATAENMQKPTLRRKFVWREHCARIFVWNVRPTVRIEYVA